MKIQIRRQWVFESKLLEGVKVDLRYLTVAELDECWEIDKRDKKPKFDINMKKMVSYAVERIHNLSVVDEKKKEIKIITAEQLLDTPGLMDLYYEIYAEVVTSNARVDSKNSQSPSDT